MVEVLKVSSKSNPNSVAGALAGVLRQTGAVEVQVVGAGALNQAIKAIAIARGFVAPSNLDLVCIPTFADILIDGQARTAIRLSVEDRTRRQPTEAPVATVAVSPTVSPTQSPMAERAVRDDVPAVAAAVAPGLTVAAEANGLMAAVAYAPSNSAPSNSAPSNSAPSNSQHALT